MPDIYTQWPSGIRDTTEFPDINISISAQLREHLQAFCNMDGVGWNDYEEQGNAGGLALADSRLRTYRKMYERLGVIYKDNDHIRLSRLGNKLRNLEAQLNTSKEQELSELRAIAIDILSRYQLRNPIDGPTLPISCDVQPYLCIWKAMRHLDNKINYEEMNRVILHVMKMSDLDAALGKIDEARALHGNYAGLSDEELTELLGEPAMTDQPTARIAPWFSFAGWGGLIIEPTVDEDGYRRLCAEAIPYIDAVIANPPTFFDTNDKDEWLAYYIGSATIQDSDTPDFPDESQRIPGGTNVILYGVPGAGKSWTIEHEYCDDESCMERLVFHPDYMYSDFIGQILPVVRDDKVRYEFQPGPFTKMLAKAYRNPAKEYFLIIEEINRGNAPAIFGEVFQLLDRLDADDKGFPVGTSAYAITNSNIANVVYGDPEHKVRIPSNLTLLGTMNTSDQNVFTLDTAFQRRWNMRMIPNSFENHRFANKKILDTTVTWKKFCAVINGEILRKITVTSSEDKRLGAYFVSAADLDFDEREDSDTILEKERVKLQHKNARFAEKVLKYLWDDAFKYSHPDTFNIKDYGDLEAIVTAFCAARGNERFSVFNEVLAADMLDDEDDVPHQGIAVSGEDNSASPTTGE